MPFPLFRQLDDNDCGRVCLRMVMAYHGLDGQEWLKKGDEYRQKSGYSLETLKNWAALGGLEGLVVKLPLVNNQEKKLSDVPLPAILFWGGNHAVVLYKISKDKFHISDPSKGKVVVSKEEMQTLWAIENGKGIALIFEPPIAGKQRKKSHFIALKPYLTPLKGRFYWLFFFLLLGSILQLGIPFFTKNIVDKAIPSGNTNWLLLLLLGQLLLVLGQLGATAMRAYHSVMVSHTLSRTLIADFLQKLVRLPIRYFETRKTGEIMQRIWDHYRIDSFITHSAVYLLFAAFTFITYGFALLYLQPILFLIFVVGTALYLWWNFHFLKKRKELDEERFKLYSNQHQQLVQITKGISDIKLYNLQNEVVGEWAGLRRDIQSIATRQIKLDQTQEIGGTVVNELKNLLVVFMCASTVMAGHLTLGTFMAIQYMIGSLNGPVNQMLTFINSWQGAKLSLERIAEVHEEIQEGDIGREDAPKDFEELVCKGVGFTYPSSVRATLENFDFVAKKGELIGVSGPNGRGKSTMMKLLLRLYEPQAGKILIDGKNISELSLQSWRDLTGAVLQESQIFNDTLRYNVTLGRPENAEKLAILAEKLCLNEILAGLPDSWGTKLGHEGTNLSKGQEQRVMLARAIYGNPKLLILDEATSALDHQSEEQVVAFLHELKKDMMVLFVTHRRDLLAQMDRVFDLTMDSSKLKVGTPK